MRDLQINTNLCDNKFIVKCIILEYTCEIKGAYNRYGIDPFYMSKIFKYNSHIITHC